MCQQIQHNTFALATQTKTKVFVYPIHRISHLKFFPFSQKWRTSRTANALETRGRLCRATNFPVANGFTIKWHIIRNKSFLHSVAWLVWFCFVFCVVHIVSHSFRFVVPVSVGNSLFVSFFSPLFSGPLSSLQWEEVKKEEKKGEAKQPWTGASKHNAFCSFIGIAVWESIEYGVKMTKNNTKTTWIYRNWNWTCEQYSFLARFVSVSLSISIFHFHCRIESILSSVSIRLRLIYIYISIQDHIGTATQKQNWINEAIKQTMVACRSQIIGTDQGIGSFPVRLSFFTIFAPKYYVLSGIKNTVLEPVAMIWSQTNMNFHFSSIWPGHDRNSLGTCVP